MDGNRRANYDGCLLPPVFINPGDPYRKPLTHDLRSFYGGSRGSGFRTGKPSRPVAEWYHRPGPHGAGAGAGGGAGDDGARKPPLLQRTGPGMKVGRATNQHGLFGFRPMTAPGGDAAGPPKARPTLRPRNKFKAPLSKSMGRGKGGLFSAPVYMGPGGDDPHGAKRGSKAGGPVWRDTDVHGAQFDRNPVRHVDVPDRAAKTYDLADQFKGDPKVAAGRGVFHKSTRGTFSEAPYAHDPYTGEHVKYTAHGLYKGRQKKGLVTYKNITRIARQNKSVPS